MKRLIVPALVLLLGGTSALAAANGRLPRSSLARIYHPQFKLYLERNAAASWNTMRLYTRARGHEIYPGGKISAYRTFAQQVHAKRIYGSNAATPGTSNHGWGLAVDLDTLSMRRTIDRMGAQFGWAKKWSDASWEWWHLKYRAGVWKRRPDPGLSTQNPKLRRGSGGPGQAPRVRQVQRHLRRHGQKIMATGRFMKGTERALKSFQRERRLPATGVVDARTWRELRGPVINGPGPR